MQTLLFAFVKLREVGDQLKYAAAMAHKDICMAVAMRAAPGRRAVLGVIYDEVIPLLALCREICAASLLTVLAGLS